MLVNLHVKNLAIIDEVDVDFSEHLNILSGETGAGKSIIIGSINIALGGKVSADIVRKGAEYALIELTFQLEEESSIEKIKELDIPMEDGQLILSRRIKNGRSLSKANGESITTAVMKEIAGIVIDIHGQHEHQSLLYKKKHLEIVDRFGGKEIADQKRKVASSYRDYILYKNKLEESVIPEEERLRELSFTEYEIKEIESANLKEGEEEELMVRHKKLSNANLIAEGLSGVHTMTSSEEVSASDLIGRATRQLGHLNDLDEELGDLESQLLEIEELLNDFNRDLGRYIDGLQFDSEEFQQVDERLQLIHNLKAKYGNSVEEIQQYYEKLLKKLEKYTDYERFVEQLRENFEKAEKTLCASSEQLSILRRQAAKELEQEILTALVDLNFLEVRFEIKIQKLDDYTLNGLDDIEFMISTNPGEETQPLAKVASGGELSRIMLAIKSVLAEKDLVDTLIFDEIDTGISGRTAQKVSEKLAQISKTHQVISITHLPQIASMADEHFIIEKNSDGKRTVTKIHSLSEEEAILELARMLGGVKITEAVIASAKEMKELAHHTICKKG